MTIINCAKIDYKTPFCYFPADACPQANLLCVTLSRRRFYYKIYNYGGEGVVVSTLGVADWNSSIGVVFIV